MLALGILVAAGVVFGVYIKVVGDREFDAPERSSSPREYF